MYTTQAKMQEEDTTMKAEQAWQATLGQLQTDMPKAAFETWVREARYLSYEDGSFIVGVTNAYARDWLQSRLSSTVNRILTSLMNRTVEISFVVWSQNSSLDLPIADDGDSDEDWNRFGTCGTAKFQS